MHCHNATTKQATFLSEVVNNRSKNGVGAGIQRFSSEPEWIRIAIF